MRNYTNFYNSNRFKMSKEKNTTNIFPIHPLIQKRWSSRSFNEVKTISQEDLDSLIEASRWAPSAFNDQPWRFLIIKRGDPLFQTVTDSLVDFNKLWAPKASVLIVVAGNTKREDDTPNYTYAYDCGQAVAFMTIEATSRDIIFHQMSGFNKTKLHQNLKLHENLDPITVIAAGYYQNDDHLAEPLKSLERIERIRKGQDEILL